MAVQAIMTIMGNAARGETANEILNVIGAEIIKTISQSQSSSMNAIIQSQMSTLFGNLKNKDYHLNMVNRIYVHNTIKINKDFNKFIKSILKVDFEQINFDDPQRAIQIINDWIKKETKNLYQELVSADILVSPVKMVLVSLACFKGRWNEPFRNAFTVQEDFYETAEKVIKVNMMKSTALYNYSECKELEAQFVEVFLQGNEASVVIGLPNEIDGLHILEKNVQKTYNPDFRQERISLSLPKFSFETNVFLKDILIQLGIKSAFSAKADFSGLSDANGDFYVNEIIHKTYISLNEEGLEVTTTMGIPVLASSTRFPPKSIPFVVNHPFLVIVKEMDLIIFEGVIRSPNS